MCPVSRIAIAVACLIPYAAAKCDPQPVRVQIGATNFCVPAESVIALPSWLTGAFAQSKDDGVAFHFPPSALSPDAQYQPALNVLGAAMDVSGTLSPRRADERLSKLPASNYWRRLVEGPGAIIDVDHDARQIRGYSNAARDSWIIWAIDPAFPVSPASIDSGGSIVAHCLKTDFRKVGNRRVDEIVTCDRRTVRDDLFLSYTFGERNARNTATLDDAVWRVVQSWRCKT